MLALLIRPVKPNSKTVGRALIQVNGDSKATGTRKKESINEAQMSFAPLSQTHAVAPQITPEDIPLLKEAGFTTIICNRPDSENPIELQSDVLRAATEAAGLSFASNPVTGGGMTLDNVAAQSELLANTEGKSLAYCASGTRCAILWAFSMAGDLQTDEILSAVASAGYQLEGMRGQIDMLAAQK